MSQSSSKLTLPYLQPAQAQKHVTHNEALERLDFLAQLTVEGFGATTAPAAPQEGAIWALGMAVQGPWEGHDGDLAGWYNGRWLFISPTVGWRAAQGEDLRIWSGSDWVPAASVDYKI